MEEKEILIRVENLSKKYCKDLKTSLKYGFQEIISRIFGKKKSQNLRDKEFWVVENVSFEVRRGECLGLIGHNGAGKSTLLKLLNGLVRPDSGSIEMYGRVGALIELGAGFNPILTGRENIYNNAAVLGFTKSEIDSKFDEIIEFSEMKEFIDSPVQYYSSGMKVRLGFAIAAQMEPDILLIDEVLAVGDIGFVLKCFNKIDQILKNTAVIFVSHGMPQVARICTNILLMNKGKQIYYSDNVAMGITSYYNQFNLEIGDFKGVDYVSIESLRLFSEGKYYSDKESITLNYNSPLNVEIQLLSNRKIDNPWIYLAFYDSEQRNFAEVYNFNEDLQFKEFDGRYSFNVFFDKIQFTQGKYSITIGLSSDIDGVRQSLFRHQSAIYFTVHGETHGWAPMQLLPEWKIEKI